MSVLFGIKMWNPTIALNNKDSFFSVNVAFFFRSLLLFPSLFHALWLESRTFSFKIFWKKFDLFVARLGNVFRLAMLVFKHFMLYYKAKRWICNAASKEIRVWKQFVLKLCSAPQRQREMVLIVCHKIVDDSSFLGTALGSNIAHHIPDSLTYVREFGITAATDISE